MKIAILTYGSRGDVQPFLALAVGLQKAGHAVTLAAPHRFENFISKYGISFAPLAGDPEEISRIMNDAGDNSFRLINGMKAYIFDIAPQVVMDVRAAIAGAEMLVHGFLFTTGAHSFAREMGIPDVSVQTFPMFAPTRAFPNVSQAKIPPGMLSYFSHWFATQIFWYGGNSGYYQLRRSVSTDLPVKLYWPFTPSPDRPVTPLLFAYSQIVLPRPAEWKAPNLHLIGYLFLDTGDKYRPPSVLDDFLASGEAPVCVSFGSMVNREAERIHRVVYEALRHLHWRGIVLSGWGGYQNPDKNEDILYLDDAPHDWLFPRCKVIIHHGGAGTTAAGLRSGKPNIVVPHMGDQLFWGRRVAALGAGPQPIPVKQLTAGRLVAALVQTEDTALQARAREMGRLIRSEDGVGEAVRLIESIIQP
jgi:sterol 3beta-glucosyltransferase